MVVGVLYLTFGAGLNFGGFNWQPTRLLGYCCFLRVVARRELSSVQFTGPDKAFLVLYVSTTLILIIRAGESAPLWCAKLLDVVLAYAAFRALIRTPGEFRWFLGILALLFVPYVAILVIERIAQKNLFSLVGAGSEIWIRDAKVRCYGSFNHPSLLGSLGACFLPLYLGLAWDRALRNRAILGAVLCVAIVALSNSGGPISAVAVALIGWFVWPLRTKMRTFRRVLAILLVALATVMEAPVWYLPAKISAITGGAGWHRSYLLEVAFNHLDQWWLAGIRDEDTAAWFPYTLVTTGGTDITNQFLLFGIQAGLAAILLFIFLIYRAFSEVGRALASVRQTPGRQREEPLLWGLGVALATHVANWFGISYFDQFNVLWLLTLAALVSMSEFCLLPPAGGDEFASHAIRGGEV